MSVDPEERSHFVEKMISKRCWKVKGGWAATEDTAVTSEGGQKLQI